MSPKRNLLNVTFDEALFHEIYPAWKGLPLEISELSGGITNKLYRVKSEKGDLAVRIWGDKTELFIDRDFEAHALEEMARIGVSSELVSYMPENGVTIVGFIDGGIVLTNDHFLDESLYPRILGAVRKIHDSGVRLKKVFHPLAEVKKMADILSGLDAAYPEFDIVGTITCLERIAEVIDIPETAYTACHNDLLADNFILIRDAFRDRYAEPLYIIDWEYAGMAPRYYDIADMFQEILVPREAEEKIVREYCQNREYDRNLRYIDLFKPFPDIFWFLWSLIQLNISTIEFDFYEYGRKKYENARENIVFLEREYGVKI